MKTRLSLILLASAALLSSAAIAESTDDTSSRVENGVTVKSPKQSSSLAPAKKASEQLENYPVAPPVKPAGAPTPAAAAAAPAPAAAAHSAPAEVEDDDPETDPDEKKIIMKPIVDKNAKAKKPDGKTIESNPSPFKKSQDAGVTETVKRPEPKPEVSSKSLMNDDDMANDIKNIEAIKKNKDKATNAEDGVGESGLPIPRFVSLKPGEANARTGPGDSYPIRWVYQRKNLPLEVTAEFRLWRRIKDFDGEQSWVHQALLSSRRYCILKHDATAQSDYEGDHNVARFKRGVQVQLMSCKKDACKIDYGNIEGWLKKKDLWGVYDSEVFD